MTALNNDCNERYVCKLKKGVDETKLPIKRNRIKFRLASVFLKATFIRKQFINKPKVFI